MGCRDDPGYVVLDDKGDAVSTDLFDGDFAYLEKENERLLAENQQLRDALKGTMKYAPIASKEYAAAREALAGDAE